jgi:uncharacterized protein (TIGR00369 family)
MTKKRDFSGSRFVGGDWENGFGLQFNVADDRSVSVTFAFGETKEGPVGLVHGGALAAVMDEAITVAAIVNNRGGLTAFLNIDYKAPVPLNTQVTAIGRIEKIDGRKTFLSAELRLADNTLAVSATGLFITMEKYAE